MSKILLAEDDPNLNFVIADHFEQEGFDIISCENGQAALEAFRAHKFDLAILDIMMPKMDGFTLASHIRNSNELIPIIFLTARSQEEDRLKGFDIGGDDYVSKPFSMKELMMRVKVFIRRSSSDSPEVRSTTSSLSGSIFDSTNLALTVAGTNYHLTEMEAKLLNMLLINKNQLVKRSDILIAIWGEDDYFKGRSLDVFVSRLRKYFKGDPKIEIRNHHGVGFTLIETSDSNTS